MQNYNLNLKSFENVREFVLDEKEDAKISSKIYQKRKSPHSSGIFGYKRARKSNS
jgi:hypothetical protein